VNVIKVNKSGLLLPVQMIVINKVQGPAEIPDDFAKQL